MSINERIIEAYVKRCDGEMPEEEYQQFIQDISKEVYNNHHDDVASVFFDPRLIAAAERSGRGEKVRRVQEKLHYGSHQVC